MGCDRAVGPITGAEHLISIHAARMGCDRITLGEGGKVTIFQSTQPEWAATPRKQQGHVLLRISIHAARMGCDGAGDAVEAVAQLISIHAARMGCD